MVEAVRRGCSQHEVAHQFHVSQATVHYWVQHAHGQRLERVDWYDRSRRPHQLQRTAADIEDLVLQTRRQLQHSDLGFWGAQAIHAELVAHDVHPLPAVRTINRILRRRGVLDGQQRVRRQPPPPGWYLPPLAAKQMELDSFDIVEGLVIQDGPQVEVLNGLSLHGGLVVSWPQQASVTADVVVQALPEHWRAFGLPGYAQFDNDMVFQGSYAHPNLLGRVTRLCLSLAVVPVFVPPREPGFQAAMENYNGNWQAKVWARFHHETLQDLQTRSERYQEALRRHRAARQEAAPCRRPFPRRWRWRPEARVHGRVIYLRRTDGVGAVQLLGQTFAVDAHWLHRLVRAEVNLDRNRIDFYRLRRREPKDQPLIKTIKHKIPQQWVDD